MRNIFSVIHLNMFTQYVLVWVTFTLIINIVPFLLLKRNFCFTQYFYPVCKFEEGRH